MDRKVIDLSGSFSLTTYLPTYPSIYLSISSVYLTVHRGIYYLPTYLSIDLSIYLSVCVSVCVSTCLSASLKAWLFYETSSFFQVDNIKNAALLRDFLIFWSWPHQKRSNSARPPHFLKLTTSKTKQFCETSSIFELNNVKNETILRDFFIFWTWQHPKRSNSTRLRQFLNLTTSKTKQFCETSFKNGQLTAELTASCQCVLRFFQSICLNYRACHEKVMPGHSKCCACHAKSSQQTWRSDAPKCNPSQEISALTSEQLRWKCLLYCACHGKCIFADPLQMSHTCHRFWQCYKTLMSCSLLGRCTIPCACHAKRALNVQTWSVCGVFCAFWLRNVLRATLACSFSTSQLLKVLRSWCVLYILTSKCASRHNGVHFLDISTSKSGPTLVCFVHFDLEMCFPPQRRALFHLSSGQMAPHPPL